MKTLLLTTLVFVGLTIELIRAQNPTPVIVQAATSAPAAAVAAAPNSAAEYRPRQPGHVAAFAGNAGHERGHD